MKVEKLNRGQGYGNKDDTGIAKMVLQGGLQQIHAGEAVCQFFRGQQHDHGGAAADHDGVDENSQGLGQTSADRVFTLSRCNRAGAEPEPASLENRPRLTPFKSTAPKPPDTAWRRPKASVKMRPNTAGSFGRFIRMINNVSRKNQQPSPGQQCPGLLRLRFSGVQ